MKSINDFDFKHLSSKRQREYIRAVMGPPRKELKGKEYDHVWLMLQLVEPFDSSNNQRTCTDKYKVGDLEYHVHFGLYANGRPMIEEVSPFED